MSVATYIASIETSRNTIRTKLVELGIPDKYQDVSGVTATAANVLDGSYFVTKTGTLTYGSMVNKGAISETIDGLTTTSYTVPDGYHNGSGKVSLTSDIENALAAI